MAEKVLLAKWLGVSVISEGKWPLNKRPVIVHIKAFCAPLALKKNEVSIVLVTGQFIYSQMPLNHFTISEQLE